MSVTNCLHRPCFFMAFFKNFRAAFLSRVGPLGPFRAEEIATLVGAAFLGAESMILLGFDDAQHPMRAALRRVGDLIAATETQKET